MLSQAENDNLARVGPGTPAGELLRRYWHPVAMAAELTEDNPIKALEILGEKLVAFRLPPGPGETEIRYGLMEEQCQHRLASLAYGTVDNEGIRCPYHGWKYDLGGQCIEQPAEPPGSNYKNEIRAPAYPVQKMAGLLWAYMGPLPAPLLPRWDVLVREDGIRSAMVVSDLECNWLQAMENSVDPAHFYWLHGYAFNPSKKAMDRGHASEKNEFIRFEYGIMKRRITPGRTPSDPPTVDEHPLVFPTTLRNVTEGRMKRSNGALTASLPRHTVDIRVPLDDKRTRIFCVHFAPTAADTAPPGQELPYEYLPVKDQEGRYRFELIKAQDAMAWETQGRLADRSREHLGSSDRGVVMFRKLLKEQIDVVRNGGDPIGVIRDPEKNKYIDFEVVGEVLGVRPEK
jgi:5,5'-dehydrodivanillate O-demethylase